MVKTLLQVPLNINIEAYPREKKLEDWKVSNYKSKSEVIRPV